jgi:hypothetical protein
MTDVAAVLNSHPRTVPGIDEDALIIAVQECLNFEPASSVCVTRDADWAGEAERRGSPSSR